MVPELHLGPINRTHIATGASLHKPGGLHGVVKGLATAQAELGLEPQVFHRIPPGRFSGAERWVPAVLPTVHPSPVLLHDGPLLHYHFALSAPGALRTRALAHASKVFHFHGPWFKEGVAQGNGTVRVVIKHLVESRVYRKFDLFTAASHAFAEELASTFTVPRTNIRVIHPGIDTSFFQPGDMSQARETLGLDQNSYLFGTIRRLEPRMGIDLAIRALVGVPDAALVIAGQGSIRSDLERLALEVGVENRVTFLGKLSHEDVPFFYRAIDASLVPTRALEGFGLVVLEAFACGTPVIAARIGGLPEAMGAWSDEWSFTPERVAELRDHMLRMMHEPPCPRELTAYAQGQSWRTAALRLEEFLRERAGA